MSTKSTVTSLTAAIAIGAAAACFAPTTHAGDWSIGVGVTVPGVVVTAPPPVYVSPPPRYYAPPAAVPGYYGPGVVCSDGYFDAYGRYYCRHRHDDDNDDND